MIMTQTEEMMTTDQEIYQKVGALDSTIKGIRDSIKILKDKPDTSSHYTKKLIEARDQIEEADDRNSEYFKQTIAKMERVLIKSSKRVKPYYKKILIGNFIAIFIFLAEIHVGPEINSSASANTPTPSGILFGFNFYGLDAIDVVLGFWFYLLILHSGMFWQTIISEIYPMNIQRQISYDLQTATNNRKEIYKLKGMLYKLLPDYLKQSLSPMLETHEEFILDNITRKVQSVFINWVVVTGVVALLTIIALHMTGILIKNHYDFWINPAILVIPVLVIAYIVHLSRSRPRKKLDG
jgi:hypothetical protein